MKAFYSSLCCSLFAITALWAQDYNQSSLEIKDIMQGDNFVGHLPSNPYWSLDNSTVYFNWNPDNALSDSLYAYTVKTKKLNKVDFDTEYHLPSPYVTYSADNNKLLYSQHGDIFLVDLATSKTTQITNTQDYEGSPHFTHHEKAVAYVKDNNLYVWDIASGTTTQVTNFGKDKKPERKKSAKDQWLYEDQLGLFDVLRERKHKEDTREQYQKKYELKAPLLIDTDGKSVRNQQISPDGKFITYLTMDRTKNEGTIVPHYVTESGYTEDQHTRSKVGDEPTKYELFVYDVEGRKNYAVSLENLKGLDYVPEYTKDYPDKPYKNENRIGYISNPIWNEDGSMAIFDISTNDYKDRWIVALNKEDGTVTNVDHQHDEAWIAGPGIGGYRRGAMGWLPDNKSIWFMSEKTGYAHLYSIKVGSEKAKALTSGNFEIYNPYISKDKKNWYFTANKNHPGDRQFYSMPLKGGSLKQLTTKTGNNDVTLSPDEKQMLISYSYSNIPTELYLQDNPMFSSNKEEQRITTSTTAQFESYSWRAPEVITFKAEDGAQVYARLYQPKEEVKNKAAVIFVHGAGYLQNAHQWWSSYFREYMFHNFLVDNGYTVMDIDYRGSAGYGRDWRTGIYRHMGGKDLSDQVDGARYLVNTLGIDQDKIGIYGGSYGGFITLMAMFNANDTFSAGAAIRSVGDWAAYNHGYTARILNTPTTDSLAYKRSSPIYFADGLKGDLLILHGMVDDNVHFQDMVRLSQKLIELGKENWEMAVYPVERHGFVEPSSWTDEYSRIYKLFQKSLRNIEE